MDKYNIQEYEAYTVDGYILKVFRVNLKASEKAKLKHTKNLDYPVYIQHGLTGSADAWFYNDDEISGVGWYFASRGYDVWLGNNRGNKYSLDNLDPNISDKNFFNFSYDDLGLYDVPAIYNKILEVTKKDKLIYVGLSQGTTQFFVAGLEETKREYIEEHTFKYIALGPIVYMHHNANELLTTAAKFNKEIWAVVGLLPTQEIATSNCIIDKSHETAIRLEQFICDRFKSICEIFVPGEKINRKMDIQLDNIIKFKTYFPSGSSIKTFVHYGQSLNLKEDKVFQKFDYGERGNMLRYYQKTPPRYDVKSWKIDTVLISGMKDNLATVLDVTNLYETLDARKVKMHWIEEWDHQTFIFARDFKPLIDILDKELP